MNSKYTVTGAAPHTWHWSNTAVAPPDTNATSAYLQEQHPRTHRHAGIDASGKQCLANSV